MKTNDPKEVLWDNLKALMAYHYGKENLTRLAKDSKCGPGTASRIKARNTSVGIEVLGKVSKIFDLQPWQLLIPGLDPANPPVISLTEQERRLYDRLKRLEKIIKETTD